MNTALPCAASKHSTFANPIEIPTSNNTMPSTPVRGEYTSAFPSSWAEVSRSTIPTLQQPEQARQDRLEGTTATALSSRHRAYDVASRDYAYPPSSAVPESAEAPKTAPGRQNSQKITKIRDPSRQPSSRSIDLSDEPQYSTVYPPSWTVSGSVPTAKPLKPSLMPQILPLAPAASTRTTSTTSQGDVVPMSPARRRMQKEFWSLSIPGKKDNSKMKQRAASMVGATGNRHPDIVVSSSRIKDYPLAGIARTLYTPKVEVRDADDGGRHESTSSRPSTYSTLERVT